MDGNYSLTVNDLKKAVLQASFIGYNTIEESVKGRSTVEIKLSPSVVNLGEVVAIGYGTQTRREITGSVANVSEESFNKGITRDASDLLQGKVAGLTITSGSGDVTRGSTMRLRGTSTLQNDQGPLIVIDGIPGGDMSTVAPSDIESISVLKDASSAAIYGSRAAGGVVLITTKGGRKEMPTKVDVNFFTGVQQNPKKLNVLNGEEYSRFARYYGFAADGYGAETDAVPYTGEGTDWQDVILNTAMVYKANVAVTGGSKNASFSASGGYLNKDGIMRNSSHESYNIRLKSDFSFLNNRVTVGESHGRRQRRYGSGYDERLVAFPQRYSYFRPGERYRMGYLCRHQPSEPLCNL